MKGIAVVTVLALLTAGCTDDPVAPPPVQSASPPGTTSPPAHLQAARSQPVDDPYYPQQGEPYLDALHYNLVLDWAVDERELTGTATITFEVTEQRTDVQLDLAAQLSVTAAELDGEPVDTSPVGDDLVVDTGDLAAREPHVLQLSYVGTPVPTEFPGSRTDIPALGWTTERDGSVWTMQEPFGAFTWYPVNDHPSDKAFYDATITTSGGLTSVFNGELTESSTEGATTTSSWHLDRPAAAYLVTVAIGDYTATQDEGPGGLPITYWTPTEQVPEQLRESPQMLAWLEDLLGPYPFATAGAVVVPASSAMETQTTTTIGDAVLDSGTYGRTVVLHEYAHQWLGDALTPGSWPDLWLNEGLTMYVQLLWEQHAGLGPLSDRIREFSERDALDRQLYGPPGAYRTDEWGSVNVYLSGALLMHRIRSATGDRVFFDALRTWAQSFHDGNVDRADFIETWSRTTGLDLQRFVRAWLVRPTAPTGPVA